MAVYVLKIYVIEVLCFVCVPPVWAFVHAVIFVINRVAFSAGLRVGPFKVLPTLKHAASRYDNCFCG